MSAAIHAKEDSRHRLIARIMIITPFLGFLGAVIMLWGTGITLTSLILCGVMYFISALGLTMGYHRLFTHKSFEAKRPLKIGLAIAGAMAAEGPAFWWCAIHRRHHQFSDSPLDPHSPHHHGDDIRGLFLGFLHAHIGWMLAAPAVNYRKYVPDLVKDEDLVWVSKNYFLWLLLGILLPGFIVLCFDPTPLAFLQGVLWGGLVRIFLLHHATWSINSICHMSGERSFDTNDQSRNNMLCAIWSLGEGWHNNHHAFPTSARHGLGTWEFDLTYLVIKLFSMVGLAENLKTPSAETLQSKQVRILV